MKYNALTPEEARVIERKGTERPFSGAYYQHEADGVYLCKRCDAPLYRSSDKFNSRCGWPSFDDEIDGQVERTPDEDEQRIEISCSTCGAHLGHVFAGEGFTPKNTRHCVNSISLRFIPATQQPLDTAYFASGCFWGTEYWFGKAVGVVSTLVGYMGGTKDNPTYEEVCSGKTGHAETIQVLFDKSQTSYEKLVELFFETHDQSQVNRQGPDVGTQYRSEVFVTSKEQEQITRNIIKVLKDRKMKVATAVTPAGKFWKAENYHQEYYKRKNGKPYCHVFQKKF